MRTVQGGPLEQRDHAVTTLSSFIASVILNALKLSAFYEAIKYFSRISLFQIIQRIEMYSNKDNLNQIIILCQFFLFSFSIS